MPTTLAPVDVCNIALSKIGAQAINSLLGQDATSLVVNRNWQLSYLEVSRASRWNCILATAVLAPVQQTPIPPNGSVSPPSSTPWLPNTTYTQGVYVSYQGSYYLVLNTYTSSSSIATDVANGNLQLWNSPGPNPVNAVAWSPNTYYPAYSFVTYGSPPYFYQVNYSYTSTNNFNNDVTTGVLTQTNLPAGYPFFPGGEGCQYASGWPFAYALPVDFVLMGNLNGNECAWDWGGGDEGSDYEIIGPNLYCDAPQGVIQYVQNQPDTTRFDPLFTNCVALKLAAMISIPLRQDGGLLERAILGEYRTALREARTKNGGEKQSRRFNPIRSSRFNQARYGGVNG